MEKDDREKVSKVEDLWVDIGARNRKEALTRVRVGDPGVLDLERACGCPMAGSPAGRSTTASARIVVLEALRLLAGKRLAAQVTAVGTTQEEIGYTGGGARTSATELDAQVAIVVDVTHATDYPGIDKRQHGDYKLGGGPVLSRGSAVNAVGVRPAGRRRREGEDPLLGRSGSADDQHRRRPHLHRRTAEWRPAW